MAFDNKALARQALSDLRGKSQNNQTNLIAQSARKVLDNQGSDYDVKLLKDYVGYKRSGASSVKRFQGSINSVINDASRIQNDISQIDIARQQGLSSGLAEGKLVQDLTYEATKLLKTNVVKDGAKAVAEFLGQDKLAGTRFLQTLGRGLRLGGAIAGVAIEAWQYGEDYFKNRNDSAVAYSQRRDAIRNFGGSQVFGRNVEGQVIDEVMSGRNIFTKVLDSLGFDSETQKAITSRLQGRLQTIADARQYSQQFGVDAYSVWAKDAASKHKDFGDLTDREKNEAIDEQLAEELNPDNYLNSPYVNSHIDREFNGVTGFLRDDIGFWTGNTRAKRRKILAEEYVKKKVLRQKADKAAREDIAERARKERADDPVENFKHKEEQHLSQAYFSNFRSRHQKHNPD